MAVPLEVFEIQPHPPHLLEQHHPPLGFFGDTSSFEVQGTLAQPPFISNGKGWFFLIFWLGASAHLPRAANSSRSRQGVHHIADRSPRCFESLGSSISRKASGLLRRRATLRPLALVAACPSFSSNQTLRKRFEQPLGRAELKHISRSSEAALTCTPPRDLGRQARVGPGGFVLGR